MRRDRRGARDDEPLRRIRGVRGVQVAKSARSPGVGAGCTARSAFTLHELGPFPCSLPPNPACAFQRTGLSSDLCRVHDGVRVDPVMAPGADDERLAPHSCHEGCPRGLVPVRVAEVPEPGDLVDCHRRAGSHSSHHRSCGAGRSAPCGGNGPGTGARACDDRPPVLPQVDLAESCYQPLHPGDGRVA